MDQWQSYQVSFTEAAWPEARTLKSPGSWSWARLNTGLGALFHSLHPGLSPWEFVPDEDNNLHIFVTLLKFYWNISAGVPASLVSNSSHESAAFLELLFSSASQNTDELGCTCFTLLKINIISASIVSTLYFVSIIYSLLCSYIFAVANLSTSLQHHSSPGEVQGLGTRSTGITGIQQFWLRTFLSRLEPDVSCR